jgi:hypothetical protein
MSKTCHDYCFAGPMENPEDCPMLPLGQVPILNLKWEDKPCKSCSCDEGLPDECLKWDDKLLCERYFFSRQEVRECIKAVQEYTRC